MKDSFYHMTFKKDFIAFEVDIFSMKIYVVVTDVVNDVTYSRKCVNTHVVIDFYDMMLSTGKQRHHMIN